MLARELSARAREQVPAALVNVVDAYEFLLSRDIAPDHIIVAGDSSGGGLALALLLALKGRDLPLPQARSRCRRGPTSHARARR